MNFIFLVTQAEVLFMKTFDSITPIQDSYKNCRNQHCYKQANPCNENIRNQ